MRAQPLFLLLGSGAEGDGIAAQECGEQGSGDAEIDARHLFADEIDVEGASAHAAVLFRNEQQLNAQFVRAAHVADDLDRTFIALIQLAISSSSGRRFLAKSSSDFKLSFRVFLVIIIDASFLFYRRLVHLAATPCVSRTLLVNSGRNSSMSATIPTSATWKIGAFGFLLMAIDETDCP